MLVAGLLALLFPLVFFTLLCRHLRLVTRRDDAGQ